MQPVSPKRLRRRVPHSAWVKEAVAHVRVLCLDIGEKRVGVAVSDPQGRVATPLVVLDGPPSADVRGIKRLAEDYEVAAILVGLPLTLAGEEGPQAERVRAEAAAVASMMGVPVVFQDERLSSAEASRVMADSGMSERQRRGSVDMVAASIILQSYLDGGGLERDGIRLDG